MIRMNFRSLKIIILVNYGFTFINRQFKRFNLQLYFIILLPSLKCYYLYCM